MPRHRFRCPLRWGDMDAQGHVNNGAYLDYLQEARVHFLLTGPPAMRDLLASGVLVVSSQVEYLSPLTAGPDPLDVDLWVTAVGGSRFEIGYELSFAGRLVARARTAAVPYDLAGPGLRRLGPAERDHLRSLLEPTEALRPVPGPGSAPSPGTGHRHALAVRWGDLDPYGHVNNVRYADYVQEARLALMTATFGWPAGEQAASGPWLVVRQDLDHRRPLDFRLAPYEVRTAVAHVGTRSFTLAVEVRDPGAETCYATARTVVVAPAPLTDGQRAHLARWQD